MEHIRCPDCSVEMEVGFIPDFSHGATLHMGWQPGLPEDWKIFGLKTGSVKADPKKALPIYAFRCPNCGLLQMHAIPKSESK